MFAASLLQVIDVTMIVFQQTDERRGSSRIEYRGTAAT